MRFLFGSRKMLGLVSCMAGMANLHGCNNHSSTGPATEPQGTIPTKELPETTVPLLRKTEMGLTTTTGGVSSSGIPTTVDDGTTNPVIDPIGQTSQTTIPDETLSNVKNPVKLSVSDDGKSVNPKHRIQPNISNEKRTKELSSIPSKRVIEENGKQPSTVEADSSNNNKQTPPPNSSIGPVPLPVSSNAANPIGGSENGSETENEHKSEKEDLSESVPESIGDDNEDKSSVDEETPISKDIALPNSPGVDELDMFGKAPEGFTRLDWLAFVGSIEQEIGWWINSSGRYRKRHFRSDSLNYFGHTLRTWSGENEFRDEYARTMVRSFLLDKTPRYEKLMIHGLDKNDIDSPWTVSIIHWNKFKQVDGAILGGVSENENVFLNDKTSEVAFFAQNTIADIFSERSCLVEFRLSELEFDVAKKSRSFYGGHQNLISWIRFLDIAPVTVEYIGKAKEHYGLIVSEIDKIVDRFSETNLILNDESKSIISQVELAKLNKLIFSIDDTDDEDSNALVPAESFLHKEMINILQRDGNGFMDKGLFDASPNIEYLLECGRKHLEDREIAGISPNFFMEFAIAVAQYVQNEESELFITFVQNKNEGDFYFKDAPTRKLFIGIMKILRDMISKQAESISADIPLPQFMQDGWSTRHKYNDPTNNEYLMNMIAYLDGIEPPEFDEPEDAGEEY